MACTAHGRDRPWWSELCQRFDRDDEADKDSGKLGTHGARCAIYPSLYPAIYPAIYRPV
jgi:hypothetical protein